MEIDGKQIIYFYVPESNQAHSYKGVYYDRNQDGDFQLRSTEQIANLFIRKSKNRTENRVYPMSRNWVVVPGRCLSTLHYMLMARNQL